VDALADPFNLGGHMASTGERAYNGGLGAVPSAGVQGTEPPGPGGWSGGRSPLEAGSILAVEGPLEKAFCLFWGEFRTLETTRLDGNYLHCDLITVGYIEIRKVSAIYKVSYVY